MILPTQRALILQDRLLTFDDCAWSCASMIKYPSDGAGSYLTSEWQNAVDNIYRCQKSGLLEVENSSFFDKYGSLVEGLRRVSPFQSGDDQILWIATFLSGTEKLHKLVEKHDLIVRFQRDVLNTDFIEDLENIFSQSGVPWSTKALVPVVHSDH